MKELEKKIMEFQVLRAGYEQLESKEKELLEAKMEVEMSLNALKEVSLLKKEGEVFINFGAGNYVRGSIKQVDKVLVGLGAGVVVEKSLEEALDIMEKRLKNIDNAIEQIRSEREIVLTKLESLRKDIESSQRSEK